MLQYEQCTAFVSIWDTAQAWVLGQLLVYNCDFNFGFVLRFLFGLFQWKKKMKNNLTHLKPESWDILPQALSWAFVKMHLCACTGSWICSSPWLQSTQRSKLVPLRTDTPQTVRAVQPFSVWLTLWRLRFGAVPNLSTQQHVPVRCFVVF